MRLALVGHSCRGEWVQLAVAERTTRRRAFEQAIQEGAAMATEVKPVSEGGDDSWWARTWLVLGRRNCPPGQPSCDPETRWYAPLMWPSAAALVGKIGPGPEFICTAPAPLCPCVSSDDVAGGAEPQQSADQGHRFAEKAAVQNEDDTRPPLEVAIHVLGRRVFHFKMPTRWKGAARGAPSKIAKVA
jgi:hypothetical protein